MRLHNLYLANSGGGAMTIRVLNGMIRSVGPERLLPSYAGKELSLSFNNAIIFPGLINSHDHLDFNLFPQLGNKVYNNYVEWGKDIHQQNKVAINRVLRVPLELRAQWGIYKNLLNGVTTVINHGVPLAVKDELITVFQQFQSLHSVQLEKWWKYKVNRPFGKAFPLVVHVGEGTDNIARQEINGLMKWNLFKRKMIGVHGVAMNEKQAASFKALVWCPVSNYFLLGRTAAIDQLKHHTDIIFGTDSTLTGEWNLWEHLRLARCTKMAGDEELFNMLTTIPAAVWQLPDRGKITAHYRADIVVAGINNGTPLDSFFAVNPENILLVLHKGNIQLFDEELHGQLVAAGISLGQFTRIEINGRRKYVRGDLPGLMKEIRKYYPGADFNKIA